MEKWEVSLEIGKKYRRNSQKYEGKWRNGQQHGVGKLHMSQNIVKFGLWQKGKLLKWLSPVDMNKDFVQSLGQLENLENA